MKALMGAVLAALAWPAFAAPDPAVLPYKLPAQIAWQGDPTKGPQYYPVWGDPHDPGPYAILLRWGPHVMSPPHIEGRERIITVLSGTFWVGTGDSGDPKAMMAMPAGSVLTY